MKIFSANMMSPNGVLFSVRWMGTDEELKGWQAHGLVPLNAEEVLSIELIGDDELEAVAFALLPMAGRVLQ